MQRKENKIVDLGSGWGTLALVLARNNPDKTVIGYELSPFPFYFSKLLKLLYRQKNLHFKRKDFFALKFEKKTLYTCYLFPGAMQKLQAKIENSSLKPPLLSSTFAMHKFKADTTFCLKDLYHTPLYFYTTYTL